MPTNKCTSFYFNIFPFAITAFCYICYQQYGLIAFIVFQELSYVEHLEILEDIGYVSAAAIKKKLLSRSFQVAVSKVFNTISSITNGSENVNFQRVQMSLESIAHRLQFVQRIYTRFLLLPNSVDITYIEGLHFLSMGKSIQSSSPLLS